MSGPSSGWGREFDEPIALPDGRKLVVLRDAAGVRPYPLIVYCGDYHCAHSVVIDANRWADHVRLSEL